MVNFSGAGKPPAGPKHGRLILMIMLLAVVAGSMWMIPRMFPARAPVPAPVQDVRIVPPQTRPATSPASTRPTEALSAAALAGVRDGSAGIEFDVVTALRRQATRGAVRAITEFDELTPADRARWVRVAGILESIPTFSREPDSDHPRDLVRLRLRERVAARRPFEVWLPFSDESRRLELIRGRAYEITGVYYKLWNTGSYQLDPETQRYGSPVVAPVLIAAARGIRPLRAARAASADGGAVSRQVWTVVGAAVLIAAYVVIRVIVSMRARKRRESAGERPRGIFGLPPRLGAKTPQREPADEKKIAAARDALELAEQIDGAPAIAVNTPGHSYQIHVASGLLDRTGDMLAKLLGAPRNTALITDENVGGAYADIVGASLEKAGFEVTVLTVPAGEASKDIAEAAKLYGPMLAAGMDRDGLVVALGGGMVGDLGGFVAATFMRGIDFVQVPTSLLAQVDASVGGKVAVNLPEGKNLVGAFHQPRAVIADIATLASLPEAQYASGLAEVVKHGVIRDEALFIRLGEQREQILARDEHVMADIVSANCRIKADVVSADEKESGVRAILNYGHTIGHALESLGHYALSHGAAVSLGMIAASHIAEAKGLIGESQTREQRELLEAFGLPVTLTGIDAENVLEIMRHDKKARGGRIRFILPVRIGRVEIYDDVTDEQIRDALAALGE